MGSNSSTSLRDQTSNKGEKEHWREKAKRVGSKNERLDRTGEDQSNISRVHFARISELKTYRNKLAGSCKKTSKRRYTFASCHQRSKGKAGKKHEMGETALWISKNTEADISSFDAWGQIRCNARRLRAAGYRAYYETK